MEIYDFLSSDLPVEVNSFINLLIKIQYYYQIILTILENLESRKIFKIASSLSLYEHWCNIAQHHQAIVNKTFVKLHI